MSSSTANHVAGVGTALGVIGRVLGAILLPVGLMIAALNPLDWYIVYLFGAGQRAPSDTECCLMRHHELR